MQLPTHPRRSDCPGAFDSRLPIGKELPIAGSFLPKYCEVFTQLQKLLRKQEFLVGTP
ncbi:hypothetical protein [Scytonema sp. PCC 10023]|uniref:hypothetical protein n=1 Tax=Scytonema sp. PCC 10023 TaxID=1680591 RepID=UPI0039C72FF4